MPHDDTSYYEDLNGDHSHTAQPRQNVPQSRSTSELGRSTTENTADRKYQEYLRGILKKGTQSADRTGVGTRKVVGRQMRFDLSEGFPLFGVRPIWAFGAFREMMWFLRGRTNIWHLLQDDVGIWTDDAYRNYRRNCSEQEPHSKEKFESLLSIGDSLSENEFAKAWGDLGDIYGKMWRDYGGEEGAHDTGGPISSYEGFDQIDNLIEQLQKNPDSRRLKVSAWHPRKHMIGAPGEDNAILPPCHVGFQVITEKMKRPERVSWRNKNNGPLVGLEAGEAPTHRLNLVWSQRSTDSILGLPFNTAGYGLLAHLLADQVGMAVGDLVFQGGDCHIYQDHISAAHELAVRRTPSSTPQLRLTSGPSRIEDYTASGITVENYTPNPKIDSEIPMAT